MVGVGVPGRVVEAGAETEVEPDVVGAVGIELVGRERALGPVARLGVAGTRPKTSDKLSSARMWGWDDKVFLRLRDRRCGKSGVGVGRKRARVRTRRIKRPLDLRCEQRLSLIHI